MSFLVTPNEAYANQATILVAAINENFDPAVTVLEYGSNQSPLTAGGVITSLPTGKTESAIKE